MRADSALVGAVLEQPNYTSGSYTKFGICLHDIECPPGKKWAESLGGPDYLQNPAEQHSVQYVVDADSIVQGVPEAAWAWHCGSPGSRPTIAIEQCGYSTFTRAQWLGDRSAIGSTYRRPNGAVVTYTAQDAADMASQLELVAKLIADIAKRRGFQIRFITAASTVAYGQTTGCVRHLDITNSVGGTVHTDPGDNYPLDVLTAKAIAYRDGGTTPSKPDAKPSTPERDWFDMATKQDLIDAIKAAQPYGVIFFKLTKGDTIYQAYPSSGTYRAVGSPADLVDRKAVLDRSGTKWIDWTSDVRNPGAFGVEVKA